MTGRNERGPFAPSLLQNTDLEGVCPRPLRRPERTGSIRCRPQQGVPKSGKVSQDGDNFPPEEPPKRFGISSKNFSFFHGRRRRLRPGSAERSFAAIGQGAGAGEARCDRGRQVGSGPEISEKLRREAGNEYADRLAHSFALTLFVYPIRFSEIKKNAKSLVS